MVAVVARIALRYAAAALVTAGLLDVDLGSQLGADPDILILVGGGIGLVVEMAYAAAKRLGWAT